MKAYLDTSVINVLLFSEHSAKDKKRLPSVTAMFEKIDAAALHAIVSLYYDVLKNQFNIVTPAELLKKLEASQR